MGKVQAGGSQGVKKQLFCQVCSVDLTATGAREYCKKTRACSTHLTADAVTLPGSAGLARFCHQCSRFEPLTCFDGVKRSCRASLSQRRVKPGPTCAPTPAAGKGAPTIGATRRAAAGAGAKAAAAGPAAGAPCDPACDAASFYQAAATASSATLPDSSDDLFGSLATSSAAGAGVGELQQCLLQQQPQQQQPQQQQWACAAGHCSSPRQQARGTSLAADDFEELLTGMMQDELAQCLAGQQQQEQQQLLLQTQPQAPCYQQQQQQQQQKQKQQQHPRLPSLPLLLGSSLLAGPCSPPPRPELHRTSSLGGPAADLVAAGGPPLAPLARSGSQPLQSYSWAGSSGPGPSAGGCWDQGLLASPAAGAHTQCPEGQGTAQGLGLAAAAAAAAAGDMSIALRRQLLLQQASQLLAEERALHQVCTTAQHTAPAGFAAGSGGSLLGQPTPQAGMGLLPCSLPGVCMQLPAAKQHCNLARQGQRLQSDPDLPWSHTSGADAFSDPPHLACALSAPAAAQPAAAAAATGIMGGHLRLQQLRQQQQHCPAPPSLQALVAGWGVGSSAAGGTAAWPQNVTGLRAQLLQASEQVALIKASVQALTDAPNVLP